MPNIKLKSQENLLAAQELIDQEMFSSSVHCSYYCCLLQMKYILSRYEDLKNKKQPLNYTDQNRLFNGKDSHIGILKEILARITDSLTFTTIKTGFFSLKQERKDADYNEKIFSREESLGVIKTAKLILFKLKITFGDL